MKSDVYFADEKLKEVYNNLENSKSEEKEIHKWISRAIDDLKQDAFTGIQIKKELFPQEYIQKYNIDNLWKYDLPKGWRLIYTVGKDRIMVISIILE
jgi:Txe/YoeB family toxin of Txe-Axe toxin-antitoxin module